MSVDTIEDSFPSLNRNNYTVTSPEDFNYNCLAFALGDLHTWWEPPGQYGFCWPPGFSQDSSVETVTRIIKLHGYSVECGPNDSPLADSIAVFARNGEWTHFAKYVDGQWFSKIGEDHDISHASLNLLESDLYGEVVRILSRPPK